MQSTRMPACRDKLAEPVSGGRDAWYVRPPHDEVSSQYFFDSRLSLAAVSPELALMYAVLEDAFLCWQQLGASAARVRRRAHQAERWFFSDDSRWIFSFLPVCDVLGLDPAYMRKKLKQWHPTDPDTTWAKR
jgi:hypothetical protein